MYDLIIIGGGPAGISAAIYAAREKLNALLITKDFLGKVSYTFFIENYPGFKKIKGLDLMKKFQEHLEKFPIDINQGEEVLEIRRRNGSFEVSTSQKDRYFSKSIIIATGGNTRKTGVPGEEKFLGKGVSFCPICDGFFFKNKKVAVIGGGDSGCEAALYLARLAKKIYLFGKKEKLTAQSINQKQVLEEPKIEVFTQSFLKEIKGKNKVEKILIDIEGTKKEIKLDGVFIRIGQIPSTDFLKKIVKLDKQGYIVIDPLTGETSQKGIFAAGDVVNIPYKQIIIAAGQGARAALSVFRYFGTQDKKNV